MNARRVWQHTTLLAMAALLTVSSIAPAAATDGRLMFYNNQTGSTVVGALAQDGIYRDLKVLPGISSGWAQIVATSNDLLLFYNRQSGNGASGRLNPDGSFVQLKSLSGFATNWTHIVAVR